MPTAKTNDKVRVHYTGKLINGEQFDSSIGREPLEFTVGAGQMIAGFDAAVNGMELNEKKTVNIPPDQAYGERDERLFFRAGLNQFPEGMDPEIGQKVMATIEAGQQRPAVIIEKDSSSVLLDANHELAGKELVFEIELVEIV